MGSYISVTECQARYNITPNCHVAGKNITVDGKADVGAPFTSIGNYTRRQFPGDPDVAGIGILGVFVAVTSFAIAAGLLSLFWQLAKTWGCKTTYTERQKAERQKRTSFSDILETLILACSDQQVFTGAAYALTLKFEKGCSISAYHYNIVANMMLLTCATHLISVTIVRTYWAYPTLALLRIACVTFVFIATGLLMTNQNGDSDRPFPTGIPNANETDSLIFLPAVCFQTGAPSVSSTFHDTTSSASVFFKDNLALSTPRNKIQGWNLYIITLLFYGAAIIAEIIRFVRRGRSRPGLRARIAKPFRQCCGLGTIQRKIVQNVFLFYLAFGIGLSFAVIIISAQYIFNLRRWVDKSGWVALNDNNQNPENDATSFGQLVPIFSSALIVFSFAQIISEKLTRHNNRKHEGEELPPQGGTIQYLDPSSYDLVPPQVPEKDRIQYQKTAEVSTTSLPQRVDLESQLSWGSETNYANAQVATPLLSNYAWVPTMPGTQQHWNSRSQNSSPQQPGSASMPSLPMPLRPQGHNRDGSSTSSRSFSTPQVRSLMDSPNLSQHSTPRPADIGKFSSRPTY
ncbi:hypothetical protein F5Y13DRAFT_183469 [Hypoxylon sp. FL1857]|nr:hypothetical protein F5Y13DRAFT_183469 [Hypoxylon sp. FL1857]